MSLTRVIRQEVTRIRTFIFYLLCSDMLFSICAVNTSSLFKAVAWEPVHFDFVLEFEVSMKVSWKPFHIGKIKERFIF